MLFFWTFYLSFTVSTIILSNIDKNVISIDNKKYKKSLFANQHIRMISEGSRDTEDCNDAENDALPSQDFFFKTII